MELIYSWEKVERLETLDAQAEIMLVLVVDVQGMTGGSGFRSALRLKVPNPTAQPMSISCEAHTSTHWN